jgi:hypothetical protein
MQGPTLTRREVSEVLQREIDSLDPPGAERPNAIQAVAQKYRVDPDRVTWLLGLELGTGGEA